MGDTPPPSPAFHVDGLTEIDGHTSTRWDEYGNDRKPNGNYDPNQGQWRNPSDRGSWINDHDPYFQHVQAAAQAQYGDPNIHYAETGSNGDKHRYLAFGDGQALPQDGRVVYRADDKYYQRNADGTVTRWIPDSKESGQGHLDGAPIHTQARQLPNGTWALFDPKTNKQVTAQSATRPGDNPAPAPSAPQAGASTATALAAGMHSPHYPPWADANNVGVETQMTETLARLYNMFGKGTPATPTTPTFPFHTDDGVDSGIDRYTELRSQFKALENEFNSSTTAFGDAVKDSKFKVETGRDAINKAIDDFGDKVHALPEGQYPELVQAEADMLSSVRTTIANAATGHTDVPDPPPSPAPSPASGPAAPGPGPLDPLPGPPAGDPSTDPTSKKLEELVNKLGNGSPLGGMPGMGGMNPLGGLGGMNPFGGGGQQGVSPLGGGGAPAPAVAKLTDPNNDPTKPAVTPLNPPAPAGVPTPAPAAAGGPSTDPSGSGGAGPVVVPAGNAGGTGTSVSLPDGKTVDAPNAQAAKAATNAITGASPGGDAAQKAYSGVMELPGDGKNPGAKIDPGDMQAGDVLKWQDKTMVAAGPGLVADPTHPGTVHQLQDVLKDGKGFQGIYRPTAVDPTLTSHSAPPPVVDIADQHPAAPPADHPPAPPPTGGGPDHPAPPPPAAVPAAPAEPAPSTIPLASPAAPAPPPQAAPAAAQTDPAAQAAPPSPFGPHTPPAATRSTKSERTAAGTE
jgi:hypothetical protein